MQATGLMYGEVITLHNCDNKFLQIDHNGWGTIHGHPDGNRDYFAVSSYKEVVCKVASVQIVAPMGVPRRRWGA